MYIYIYIHIHIHVYIYTYVSNICCIHMSYTYVIYMCYIHMLYMRRVLPSLASALARALAASLPPPPLCFPACATFRRRPSSVRLDSIAWSARSSCLAGYRFRFNARIVQSPSTPPVENEQRSATLSPVPGEPSLPPPLWWAPTVLSGRGSLVCTPHTCVNAGAGKAPEQFVVCMKMCCRCLCVLVL